MKNNEKDIILQVKNLSYSYEDNKDVLNNINLDIYKGEKIAILGSNGAGKSTLFLNLNGVLHPENGEIIYNEQIINKKNINELRKNVGIVFQDADNQIIASTVLGEVSFGPMNLKLSKEEVKERVYEALEYMNITKFKDRPPHYLSGGEKKRVSIADIIAMRPEVIIFDEPTASLDPVNIDMLEKVLLKLENENKTIVISTHDVDFAFRWAKRIIVIGDKRIISDGAPIEVFTNKEILKKANLKTPTILEVYNILVDKKVIDKDTKCPKDINEFNDIFK